MTNPLPTLTPEQLLALITQELTASGNTLLTSHDGGPPLTLRQAIAALLWKTTFPLNLSNRPLPPTAQDDAYGHILTTHAISLQVLALVAAMSQTMGIPVTPILNSVQQSLNSTTQPNPSTPQQNPPPTQNTPPPAHTPILPGFPS